LNSFDLKFETHDGIQLYARGWEPEGGPGASSLKIKAVVCLIPGLGEHAGRYQHVAAAMTQSGYAVFGFDLRGHGLSGGPRGHAPSLEAYLQDIDLLLGQARRRYPAAPVFLYGHSLGGILVLNYGLRRKPALMGAIVTAPALHSELESQPVKIALVRILGALLPSLSISTGLKPERISRDRDVVQAYIADPLVHDRATLGWGRLTLACNAWTLAHAGEFPLPLLLMQGKDDLLAFPSSSLEVAAQLQDKCKLVLWDGMYHEIHNEPGKEKVIRTMIDWMDAELSK